MGVTQRDREGENKRLIYHTTFYIFMRKIIIISNNAVSIYIRSRESNCVKTVQKPTKNANLALTQVN